MGRFLEPGPLSTPDLAAVAASCSICSPPVGVRLALMVLDPSTRSRAFQDFAREANRGWDVGVFATRGEAVAWFEKDGQIEGARTSGAPGFNARAALDVITR